VVWIVSLFTRKMDKETVNNMFKCFKK